MTPAKEYNLEKRLIAFAIMIINVVERLPETRVCVLLGGQLLRSGTSAALNYGEAQAAESNRDFVHKLKVILKELRESAINLQIPINKPMITDDTTLKECKELIAIFTASIKTARRRSPKS